MHDVQVLQSLPRATGQVLEDFDQAFEAATAERDSRHAVKVLLRDAGQHPSMWLSCHVTACKADVKALCTQFAAAVAWHR